MKTEELIKGLQVLMPYYDSDYNIGAEHDVIYAYATDRPLSEKDIEKMIVLGWHQEHDERDYSEDYSVEDYREDESWVCYT